MRFGGFRRDATARRVAASDRMLIYLDMRCFNRPFDDQSQARIRFETEAKLIV